MFVVPNAKSTSLPHTLWIVELWSPAIWLCIPNLANIRYRCCEYLNHETQPSSQPSKNSNVPQHYPAFIIPTNSSTHIRNILAQLGHNGESSNHILLVCRRLCCHCCLVGHWKWSCQTFMKLHNSTKPQNSRVSAVWFSTTVRSLFAKTILPMCSSHCWKTVLWKLIKRFHNFSMSK